MLTVACVKVGAKYGPEYPNILAAMVRRHTTVPHRFVCLTDDPTGVTCETAPIGVPDPGWWAKLVLFQPHPALGEPARDRVVYLDLDTVIVGNIDPLLTYTGPFAILSDWVPRNYNSSIMAFTVGDLAHVWRRYQMDPARIRSTFWSDQEWIYANAPDAPLIQRMAPWFAGSYRLHHLETSPKPFRVVLFHGDLKPHQCNSWVQDAWRTDPTCQ